MSNFTLFTKAQRSSYCGPCSMAYCLHVLGIDVDQDEVSKASGLSRHQRYFDGHDEMGLRRAARTFMARCRFLQIADPDRGSAFIRQLGKHVRQGRPAVLLVHDYAHWVAIAGYHPEPDVFIVDDPNKERTFSRWSSATLIRKAWNEDKESGEYFAILVSRVDRRPPRWRLTEEFLKLCERGSGDDAAVMTADLLEMAQRASLTTRPASRGRSLVDLMDQMEDTVISNVWHWTADTGRVTCRDIRNQYRDYRIVADAAGIIAQNRIDSAALVAQLSSILTTYIWYNGEV